MRKLHKWFGLVLALQFVLWMASGLIMSLLDHDKVQGHHHRAEKVPTTTAWPSGLLSPSDVLAQAARPLRAVEAFWLRDHPVYRLSDESSAWLVDARDGTRVRVDAATVRAAAAADYVGQGSAGMPELMQSATLAVRGHSVPIWRVGFNDEDNTTLYISGQDGRILERRNDAWRLFDIVWMLHIMDYTNRDDFNNPLVVTAAAGGLWIALTGAWLLIASVRMRRSARRRAVA
ncbi:MAG: hypothetical protein ABIP49_08715 [Lysobacterales bacterium]